MKVCEVLQIDADTFFDNLTTSVLWDIEQACGDKLTSDELQDGYLYTKKMAGMFGQTGDVKVEIKQFDPPKNYTVIFHTAVGDTEVSYSVGAAPDGGCSVEYSERFLTSSVSTNASYKIMGVIAQLGGKRRIRDMLRRMGNPV